MPSRKEPRYLFLSSKWLIAPQPAMVAAVAGLPEPFNMSRVPVDRCHLLLILTEELRAVANSALDQFRLEFLECLVLAMLKAHLLQAQLPFTFKPRVKCNRMEEVFSMVSAVSTTMPLPLSAGVHLEAQNTG